MSTKALETPAAEKPPVDAGATAIEAMTPDELEKNKQRFLYAQGFTSTDPDAAAPVVEKPKTEAAAEKKVEEKPKEEKPKEEKPPVEAKKERKTATPSVSMTKEDLASAVEAGARAAIQSEREVAPVVETVVAPAAMEHLEPDDKETIATLQFMELSGQAPKGTAKQTLEFWPKEQAYVRAWKKSNPGQEFDVQAPEHSEFYASNEPDVDQTKFEAAKKQRIEAVSRQETEGLRKDVKELKEGLQREQFERQREKKLPEIEKSVGSAVVSLIERASPEMAKLLGEEGKRDISVESRAKMEEADPVAFEILDETNERLKVVAKELGLLMSFPQHHQFDPNLIVKLPNGERIKPHEELLTLVTDLESDIASMPAEESVRDGKAFLAQAGLAEREQKIVKAGNMTEQQKKSALRDLYDRYWTLTPKDIEAALIDDLAEKAKARIDKINVAVDRRLKHGSAEHGKTQAKPKEERASAPPAKSGREAPPSMAVSSDKVNIGSGGNSNGASQGDAIDRAMGWA